MLLREDLADLMPMVNEANAISQELDKKVTFVSDIDSILSPPLFLQQTDGPSACYLPMASRCV